MSAGNPSSHPSTNPSTPLPSSSTLTAGTYAGLSAQQGRPMDPVDFTFALFSATGPLVRLTDPETAHKIGIWAFKNGLSPVDPRPDPTSLEVRLWGKTFPNPLGLAAGFDKNAECPEAMLRMGFGFVEIGSVTPQPQPGNPLPRVFRLPEHGAIINRYGFNSEGMDAVHGNLTEFRRRQLEGRFLTSGLLAVNLGKNKTTEDAAADYCLGLARLGQFADVLVVNISSPNTPGLRALQGRKQLVDLVQRVQRQRDAMTWGPSGAPPLLVKIAPDLAEEDIKDIAAVAQETSE
jgi:dihydroorotate dehydrogenase